MNNEIIFDFRKNYKQKRKFTKIIGFSLLCLSPINVFLFLYINLIIDQNITNSLNKIYEENHKPLYYQYQDIFPIKIIKEFDNKNLKILN